VGFFGSGGFGQSVPVGEYAGTVYTTNSSASIQGPQLTNTKYVNSSSGLLGGATLLNLRSIPNSQSTFEIRIASDVAIQIQNARLYVTERTSTTGMPAGMTIQTAEVDHTGGSQDNTGLGNTTWAAIGGSGFYLALGNSPGPSGMTSGSNVLHSYYIVMSTSPNSVGSKTATARFQAEFF
jgi:hypothetical protein